MTNNISYPSSFILLSLSVFGTLSLILVSVTLVSSGSHRPYGVSLTGFQDSASGTSGHDISANGYAGSSLVAPLAANGYNSPLRQHTPSPVYPGNSYGIGFGGYGGGSSNSQSAHVAGGQGKLPSAAYSG